MAVAVRTVKAVRGKLTNTRRIAGSVSAGRFANIVAPRLEAPDQGRGLVLIYLAESGKMVKEGEIVAKIDAQAVRDHIDDVEADISQVELDMRRRKAQQAVEMEALRQRLRVAKANYEKALLDSRTVEVQTPINVELLKLAVSEAEAVYKELTSEIPMVQDRQTSDMAISQYGYDRQIRHLNRHKVDAIRCEIKTPMAGLVVMQTLNQRGGEPRQIRLGDELSPGQPFMRVVDPSSMQLDASMSQTESEDLRLGQAATVRFDAFPDILLRAHVKAIGAMAVGGRRLNYYIRRVPVRVALDDSDHRVIPDLSASADVVLGENEQGLLVPREAIIEKQGKSLVYVREAGGVTPHEVEIGAMNTTHATVVSGLEAGADVVLQQN